MFVLSYQLPAGGCGADGERVDASVRFLDLANATFPTGRVATRGSVGHGSAAMGFAARSIRDRVSLAMGARRNAARSSVAHRFCVCRSTTVVPRASDAYRACRRKHEWVGGSGHMHGLSDSGDSLPTDHPSAVRETRIVIEVVTVMVVMSVCVRATVIVSTVIVSTVIVAPTPVVMAVVMAVTVMMSVKSASITIVAPRWSICPHTWSGVEETTVEVPTSADTGIIRLLPEPERRDGGHCRHFVDGCATICVTVTLTHSTTTASTEGFQLNHTRLQRASVCAVSTEGFEPNHTRPRLSP